MASREAVATLRCRPPPARRSSACPARGMLPPTASPTRTGSEPCPLRHASASRPDQRARWRRTIDPASSVLASATASRLRTKPVEQVDRAASVTRTTGAATKVRYHVLDSHAARGTSARNLRSPTSRSTSRYLLRARILIRTATRLDDRGSRLVALLRWARQVRRELWGWACLPTCALLASALLELVRRR